ncbi:MAG: putative pre-16S rRNA nuclease [Myxococcota bacterium]|nr:putative pre-16S rRNA nuclease [Myxococcota bacterium]
MAPRETTSTILAGRAFREKLIARGQSMNHALSYPPGPVLALDVGSRTIGTAVSDAGGTIASPLKVIERKSIARDCEAILRLMAGYEARLVVIGLPLNMSGSEGGAVKRSRDIGQALAAAGAAVEYEDERMSTQAVERMLIGADVSRQKRKDVVDKLAACYILQGYLDRIRTARAEGGEEP